MIECHEITRIRDREVVWKLTTNSVRRKMWNDIVSYNYDFGIKRWLYINFYALDWKYNNATSSRKHKETQGDTQNRDN